MKNTKLVYILSLFLIPLFIGCDKESEGLSFETNYVVITLDGASVVTLAQGSDYVDAGYSAVEGENDVTSTVDVSTIDNSVLGDQVITYSAVNLDGYASSATRKVIVYDPTVAVANDDLTGTYSTTTVRTESDGSDPRTRSSEIEITTIGNGVHYVSCLLGDYYAAGYGPAYAMTGYFTLKSDYTFELISSYVQGWGDGLEAFQNSSYTPATNVAVWESVYAGSDNFSVTSTKQ